MPHAKHGRKAPLSFYLKSESAALLTLNGEADGLLESSEVARAWGMLCAYAAFPAS
jgi:hypothetical protein